MSYLINNDLKRLIQSDNLNQIIGSDPTILTNSIISAQEKAISHLIQKYDTSAEFTDTNVWDPTVIYKSANRVYLDAPAYDNTKTYAIGNLCLNNGVVYSCSVAITVAEAFTAGHWTSLGNQYAIFYVTSPQPVFNLQAYYPTGSKVFWKNKVYTSVAPSKTIDHDSMIQYASFEDIPYQNYFPDDTLNGSRQWGAGVSFSVPVATLPTNTTYWTAGDNRSQNMIEYIIDIALYNIHSRIAPRNIPDLRVKRYDDAIKSLEGYAKGRTTANLTKIQPPQGNRIRYGGQPKQTNNY